MSAKTKFDVADLAVIASLAFGAAGISDVSFATRMTALVVTFIAICAYIWIREPWSINSKIISVSIALLIGQHLGKELIKHRPIDPPELDFGPPFQVRPRGGDSPISFNWPFQNNGDSTAYGLKQIYTARWSDHWDRALEAEMFQGLYANIDTTQAGDLPATQIEILPVNTPMGNYEAQSYAEGKELVYMGVLVQYTEKGGATKTVERCYVVFTGSLPHPCPGHNKTY